MSQTVTCVPGAPDACRRYLPGAIPTEVSIAYTDIGTPEEQQRTIALLGGLNRSRAGRLVTA